MATEYVRPVTNLAQNLAADGFVRLTQPNRFLFCLQTQPTVFESVGGDDSAEVEVGQIPTSLSRVRYLYAQARQSIFYVAPLRVFFFQVTVGAFSRLDWVIFTR